MKKSKSPRDSRKSLSFKAHPMWWVGLIAVVVVALAASVWSAQQMRQPGGDGYPKASTSASPSPSASASSQPRAGQPSSRNLGTPSPTPVVSGAPSGPALPPPEGALLNVHSASLAGGTKLVSACSTQPGAMCQVQAKQGGTVKLGTAVKADGTGAAEINWTAQGMGLGIGNWEIRVVASLNGQTSTSTIFDTLEVKP